MNYRLQTRESSLSHWPIQLHLVSPKMLPLDGAQLFLVADCVPFACAEFHRRILKCRPVVIGLSEAGRWPGVRREAGRYLSP